MTEKSVIVVGGGIAGLTAAALLAYEGNEVILLEAHAQTGGCAGTFTRGPYVFDVGATQVAGFEKGGIHDRIFRHLHCSKPEAEVLDPACIVHLGGGQEPIHLWHDSLKWEKERKKHFPEVSFFGCYVINYIVVTGLLLAVTLSCRFKIFGISNNF